MHLSQHFFLRAAAAAALTASAAACSPASDPAKACAAPETLAGLKGALLSAASITPEPAGLRLAMDLPRLSAFDRTTKKATCEARLTTGVTLPGVAPRQVVETATYTVQPSARPGETVYAIASAPAAVSLVRNAVAPAATAQIAGAAGDLPPLDYGPLGAPEAESTYAGPKTPAAKIAAVRDYWRKGCEVSNGVACDAETIQASGENTRAWFYDVWKARPELITTHDVATMHAKEKAEIQETCDSASLDVPGVEPTELSPKMKAACAKLPSFQDRVAHLPKAGGA